MGRTPHVMVFSWYAPDRMDAGELIRLGQVTKSFDRHADVTWALVDRGTITDLNRNYRTPELLNANMAYSISATDYLRALARGRPIEAHRLARSRSLRVWATRLFEEIRPDAVWVNQPFVWELVPPAWRRTSVLDTHNVNSVRLSRIASSEGNVAKSKVANIQAHLTRGFERRYLSEAAMTVAVSQEDKKSLIHSRADANVQVIQNGVELIESAKTRLAQRDEAVSCLFLGSLGYSANLSALRQLAEWIDDSPGLPLEVTVAGSGDPSAARRICEGRRQMRFVGRVDDVRALMQEHHALIAPHRQGGGSRIKVLEAMGTRLPVVGTRVAVEGLRLSEGAHYFNVEDAVSFREALNLLHQPSEVRRRVARSWAIAEENQWKTLSERAWQAVADTLAGHEERAVRRTP